MIDLRTPKYADGMRVRACVDLVNDGSFPHEAPDALLVREGADGEIVQVGAHVDSNTPVYMVDFGGRLIIGCFEEEITPIRDLG